MNRKNMANMFNQMKDLYKMQKEAKALQKKMRERKIAGESNDGKVVVYMNGAQEFEDIHIDDSLLEPGMINVIREGMKEAYKDFQKKLQKDLQKDFDVDQLKGMLGN